MTSPTTPFISQDAIRRLLMQGGDPSAMFSGDPSQPSAAPGAPGTPSPTPSPAPPSGTLAQNMQPSPPTFGPAMGSTEDLENRGLASATTPRPTAPVSGAISGATPAATYNSPAEYNAANPDAAKAFMTPRPVGFSPKQSILASLFAGLAEYGGEKNRHPGLGAPIVQRLVDQNLAQRQYDAQQPQMQARAQNEAYNQYQEQQGKGAQTGLTQAETGKTQATTATAFLPAQQKVLDQVRADKQSGKFPDDNALFQAHLQDLQTTPGLTRQMLVDAINNSSTLGSKYTLTRDPQTQAPIELTDRQGNKYSASNLPNDPEAKQMWADAQTAATQKEGVEESKEKRVAGYAADRQAQAQQFQSQQERVKAVQPRVDSALDADERLSRMESNYAKAKQGDQQAQLALLADHLGMTFGLQKGARINKGLIEGAEESQPWLQKMGAKFDKDGYLSGVALGPDQMKQMLDLGYTARDQAWKTAHDASTSFGVPIPQGALQVESQRQPGAKPALQQAGQGGASQKIAVGQQVTIKGKSMKVTAVHPDGSFDAQ